MKVYDTNEHTADRPVPVDAPCVNLSLRTRDALYAYGEQVRPEYAILANMDADGEWLSIQRRERAYLDGNRELVVDLGDWA